MFGNMNEQQHQMTQYIPMQSLSSCMKEVRLLKKKNTGYDKDAFCSPAIVEIKNDEVVALYNEVPEESTMVKKDISVEAFQRLTLKAKEKWNKDKSD